MFDYETLRLIWWALLGVLLCGFAVFDGFDLGAAMLHPFVAKKDVEKNILYVVQGHDHPALLSTELHADQLAWIAGEAPPQDQPYTAKSRYRQRDSSCRFGLLEDENFALHFETPHWAVTPGQSAVLYDGAVCLGGGVITSAL